jgi:hypothetical protein
MRVMPGFTPIRFLGLMISFLLLVSPCLAGEKYFTGGPVISAAIDGSNQLIIGESITLPVVVQNTGLIDMKFVQEGTITPDYLPNTALSLTALLQPGGTPLDITSDPQILGDLPAGETAKANFAVTVPEGAEAGSYQVPLKVTYRYMYQATQIGTDDIQYIFKDQANTVYIPVTLRRAVSIDVLDVNSSGIIVGGEGQLKLLVRNSGSDDGRNTVFFINPVGQSPIVPYQDSVYAGDFPIGTTIPLSYKISIDSNANPSLLYPMEIWAVYTDYQGITTQSATKSLGAGFGPKIEFVVTSPPAVVHAGAQDIIKVTYKNTGQTTAYNAQANINIVDPFSSEDDQSYLGTLAAGESATAEFKLTTTSGSTAKEYALDSEVRYTDNEQTEYVSDPIKVPVVVQAQSGISPIVAGGVILVIAIIAGIILYRRYRRS